MVILVLADNWNDSEWVLTRQKLKREGIRAVGAADLRMVEAALREADVDRRELAVVLIAADFFGHSDDCVRRLQEWVRDFLAPSYPFAWAKSLDRSDLALQPAGLFSCEPIGEFKEFLDALRGIEVRA